MIILKEHARKKMKTETIKQVIDYVLEAQVVKNHINTLEALPNRFVIFQICATVINHQKSIIRVFINFHEVDNPNTYKEDVIVDVQGTTYSDFKILGILPGQA